MAVESVNGKTGVVVLTASNVEAVPIKLGLNGLYKLAATNAEKADVKLARENIGAGPGSPRTLSFGEEGIKAIEKFAKTEKGYTALPVYVPRVKVGSEEKQFIKLVTHAQIEEDIKGICKWIKELNEKVKYQAITELEFMNEAYDEWPQFYSAKEYAEGYAIAHKICKENGITLLANAWGDVQKLENRLNTTLKKEAVKSATTLELVSVAGMPATGRICLEEEVFEYSKIVGNVVTLDSATAAAHVAGTVVVASTEASNSFSQAEYGGGWCYLICKHLAEISEAPKVPDAWSFHPYGNITGHTTDGSAGSNPNEQGWLTTFVLMERLREQGISAPMHITEMGNAITGEGGVAGPELSKRGVEEYLLNYLYDAKAKGIASFYGFYTYKQIEEASFQETWASAARYSNEEESFKDMYITEPLETSTEGTIELATSLSSIPRAYGAEILGAQRAKYFLTAEMAGRPEEGYNVILLKLYNLKGEAVKEVVKLTSVCWWVKR